MNPVDLHVGATVKAIRKKDGWTRIALAAAIDVEPEMLRRFENGLERIPPNIIMKIAKILRVEIGQFFKGVVEPNPPQNEGGSDVDGNDEVANLLRNFTRICDAKTRVLILSMVAAYAENESANGGKCGQT